MTTKTTEELGHECAAEAAKQGGEYPFDESEDGEPAHKAFDLEILARKVARLEFDSKVVEIAYALVKDEDASFWIQADGLDEEIKVSEIATPEAAEARYSKWCGDHDATDGKDLDLPDPYRR